MTTGPSDAVVIGGGIIGCSTAYYLAKAGLAVTLVERRGIAAEASGANVGLVLNMGQEPGSILARLVRESTRLLPGLDDELGSETEYRQAGALRICLTPEALAEARQEAARQQTAGLDVQVLSPEEALAIEPLLPPHLLGAAFCPIDGYVNPLSLTAAFARAALKLGAHLLCPAMATGIEVQRGAVTAVETDRGRILTRLVVNAAGAWAGQIGRFVGLDVPVIPSRGQVLVTEPMPRMITRILGGARPSIRQTKSGTFMIGSAREFVGYNKNTEPSMITEFARGVCALYPFLRDANVIRSWAGLRPATPDHLPFLGWVDEVQGFILATGHFHHGVGCGPATGKVIAELITGKPTSVSLAGCGLGRTLAVV
ncbi:MAG: FAD-binding oxidoreductase [Chloroflexi bacterium]|nr:FAD-binding oxidoreductase [Chloroflexota bacterium]